jgi:predicted dehydrogenase
VDEALGERKDNPALRIAYGMTTISLIHQIYMLFGLFGKPQKVISTDVWREGMSIHSVIQLNDTVNITLDWHFLSHLKDYQEEYAVYGNHDRVILNFPSPYYRNFPTPVTVQGGEGELAWEKKITVSLAEAFENELLAFYDNVVNRKKPRSSVEDALMHAEFVQEIINAAR